MQGRATKPSDNRHTGSGARSRVTRLHRAHDGGHLIQKDRLRHLCHPIVSTTRLAPESLCDWSMGSDAGIVGILQSYTHLCPCHCHRAAAGPPLPWRGCLSSLAWLLSSDKDTAKSFTNSHCQPMHDRCVKSGIHSSGSMPCALPRRVRGHNNERRQNAI